jgi:hypothetical protein
MNQKPKILILATISGGYAGANAVGQLHSDYPANTYILPVLCPSMFPPQFYLDSFAQSGENDQEFRRMPITQSGDADRGFRFMPITGGAEQAG